MPSRPQPPPPSSSELAALVALLDDPSPVVKEHVRARLREAWPSAHAALEAILASAPKERAGPLAAMLHTFHVDDLAAHWRLLIREPDADLEAGAFLLARYAYPHLDEAAYRRRIDAFAARIRPRVTAASGSARALILSTFFCDQLGFTGHQKNYYDYRNSYLNWVIDHRLGIPISLSVLYLLLGERLELPVYGANLPMHFLVKYEDARTELFLDLFHGGTPLNRMDVRRFLKEANVPITAESFARADARTILLRMVRNLLFVARRRNDAEAARDFGRLLEVGPEQEG
ncbi:transglutaminase family protein [Rhodocaloribacter sp.]